MATMVANLWPKQIKPGILSPKQILAGQANALSDQTKGVLVGELSESRSEDRKIVLKLIMFVPAINYRHTVLTATYALPLVYPVTVDAEVFRRTNVHGMLPVHMLPGKPDTRADNDEELLKLIESVLHSHEVVSTAQSLIALANEDTPTNYVVYLNSLSETERQTAVDDKIAESYHEILNSESFGAAIAMTNAVGWGLDEYEVEQLDLRENECVVKLSYAASGEQDAEKPYSGDKVSGTAEAIINSQGTVKYRDITADVEHETDKPDPEENGTASPE